MYVTRNAMRRLGYATSLLATLPLALGCADSGEPGLDYSVEEEAIPRIVFLGDSITESGAASGGYVTLVADSLQAVYGDGAVEVIGAGISGNKVPDLLGRLQSDVLAQKPSHVVIYIGINDVWHHFEFDHVSGTDPAEYDAGLRQLVASVDSAGASVLLCTPSVIGEDTDSPAPVNQRLEEYAEVSRRVATETGARLCDLRQEFQQYLRQANPEKAYEGILTSDGVHLNERGNRFVADIMVRHITEVLGPE